MRRFVTVVVIALCAGGCYRASVSTGLAAAAEPNQQSRWTNAWFAGLIGPGDFEAADFCGGGNAAVVETKHSFLNLLVETVTLFIYAPVTVTVTCARQ
jgi:hypothetical protein